MSFQAYLDNIKAKTGKEPGDFKKLAEERGLLAPGVKAGEVVKWLKEDFELGHGHAMAIYTAFKEMNEPAPDASGQLDKHFTGNKAKWRKPFETLTAGLENTCEGFHTAPVSTYISLLKGDKKFGVVQVTGERMDIGMKLKGVDATDRLEASGTWNNLVTHRVKITYAEQIDDELLGWLHLSHEQIVKKR